MHGVDRYGNALTCEGRLPSSLWAVLQNQAVSQIWVGALSIREKGIFFIHPPRPSAAVGEGLRPCWLLLAFVGLVGEVKACCYGVGLGVMVDVCELWPVF